MRQCWVLTQFKFSLLPGTRLVKIIFWDKLTFWTKPYLFLRHCVDCRVSCVLCWLHCVCKKNRGQSGWSGGVSPIRGVDGKAVNEPNGNYNSWTTIERFKLSWEISVNSIFTPQQCFVIFLLIIDVIAMGREHFQRGIFMFTSANRGWRRRYQNDSSALSERNEDWGHCNEIIYAKISDHPMLKLRSKCYNRGANVRIEV